MDPVRLMHELYPELEILVTECLATNNAFGNLRRTKTNVNSQRRQRVRVVAKYKGRLLNGEGFNLRTAKLKIAQQLGIGELLRASNNFTDYNFRTYFTRRIKEEFRKHEHSKSSEEQDKFIAEAEKILGILQRQSALSNFYRGLKLPIE
ncbi:unnamed protein product [Hydatigera taeniaeformis]|uniref:Complex1_LYR_dom domain-containing protein n=1 Tax=Hydatigena taeniaeformis TaxID=6205 RepID=A0A0R3WTQ8_HYDTA|nr:unnamed protein product [Hydatigera taeniaeformis]